MSDIISVLPEEPRKALVALAEFRFLTVKQFVRLGVAASDTVMRDYVLQRLERRARPLAKSKKLSRWLPKVHYLTKHGAEEIEKLYRLDPGAIKYPVGQVQFSEFFARHRFAQIDFHIGFRQWVLSRPDTDVLFADLDFHTDGSRRHGTFTKKTEIPIPGYDKPIVADGVFAAERHGKPIIYANEVHRTTQTKAVGLQLQKYLDVLATGAVNFKYGMAETPVVVCSVHTRDNVLRGAKDYLRSIPDFANFKELVLFNSAEQLAEDFSAGWHTADDQERHPFPRTKAPFEGDLVDFLY